MCTLCLEDMGDLRDDWLREPRKAAAATTAGPQIAGSPVTTEKLPPDRRLPVNAPGARSAGGMAAAAP